MHDLPGAIFRSKDHRNPQCDWDDIITSANLGLGPLHPNDVGKLGSCVLLYALGIGSGLIGVFIFASVEWVFGADGDDS
jgi:hypothetical protein